ncbi:MAG: acyl-CoA dehydrogenase family protein [Candidatus Kapabacteria bacterium]|nr:acyl-CoA dehydrogenase family protein [Candidatus Kapabacteria bacterium]
MPLNRNLTQEHILLRDTIRKFAEEEVKPKAKELDEKEMFSYDLTKQMAELGLASYSLSQYRAAEYPSCRMQRFESTRSGPA